MQPVYQSLQEYVLTEIPQRIIQTEMIHGENVEEIVSKLESKLFGGAK